MEANKLCYTGDMSRSEWLEVRKHGPDGSIPVTIGGSDAGTALGYNPWKTPLDLFLEKTEYIKIGEDVNEGQKELGLLLEPIIAYLFKKKTGFEIVEDHWMYQHPQYKWAIADIDYFVRDMFGNRFLLDCKSTSYRNKNDIELWRMGIVPIHYEFQGRLYMAILDIDKIYFACYWGNNPKTDFAICEVVRDYAIEQKMLNDLDTYVMLCEHGIKPVFGEDERYAKLALDSLRRIYKGGKERIVIFDPSYRKQFVKLYVLDQKRKRMSAEMSEIEGEIRKAMIPIVQAMRDYETARCLLEDGSIIQFDYKKSVGARESRRKNIKLLPAA